MDQYFGTYHRFETPSKKDAALLLGADNLVGDKYDIEFVTESGQRAAWLRNRFGAKIGFFDARLLAAAERHRRPRLDRAGGAFLRGLHRPACSRPLLGRSGRHLLRSRAGRRIRPVCGQPFPPPCRRRAPRGRTGRTGRGQGRREQGVVGARQTRPLPRERDRAPPS